MDTTTEKTALDIVRTYGLVRARELALLGVAGGTLQKLLNTGGLVRLGRGVYAHPDREVHELDELGPLAIKYPGLVFCLLTALQVHGLTTQSPHEVWVAIGQKARAPKVDHPPLRIVRMSDISYGITQTAVGDVVQIPVTNIAKTIADCFKFRNKIGLDVALEALRDAWQQKKVTMDELWKAAEHCRVANVMRPYLESLV
ncbi:transcriptional regulator [Limnohabitans sp. JirII-29]|uniref:type IV toxin-antitoxin system AbiEi family antitoxin domain-containing protein n=1 Tax=Limnohabitans sp. JirII-29 TaxID=1835756 RepID=UPI000D3BD2A5|nr:type IV toxin-antitoxin system AbiEi family antitoxin domain-containing protein [Limnohabitans sp. JirII-29]PUE26623.1 transcriptional regulator [Limnohabitans sp. JirII-29]